MLTTAICSLFQTHCCCYRLFVLVFRGLEDWGNLYQHALNADNSPQFQAYMVVHGWSWSNEHPGDIAVR
jgi:hypothetical protein